MKPFIVLISTFIITIIALKLAKRPLSYPLAGQIAMSCMLVFTAVGHFIFTKGMTAMLPEFIPLKIEVVIASGLLEIAFAIGLLFPAYRQLTGWALILFFIFTLPVNIRSAIQNINYQTGELNGPGLHYLWFRVPLQMLFIGWVYFSAIKNNILH
ncbi:MAG TPA: hypothetical protein DCS93_39400 [Microscillaceae bacterium]|nr:hypothetical protein [Microscillaceae bacterium]